MVVLELLHGRTLIEFGVRPGARLDFHASAHGLVALAFGPSRCWVGGARSERRRGRRRRDRGIELARFGGAGRRRGWASAPDQVMVGVNALAAPVL